METVGRDSDFREALIAAARYLKRNPEGASRESEIRKLFLEGSEDQEKVKAFEKHFHEYEDLIFYSWKASEGLNQAAYLFWDTVLKDPETCFSGNSILRILGYPPRENLLKIMRDHRAKFFEEEAFKSLLQKTIEAHLKNGGLFDFEKQAYGVWQKEERALWERILKLF